VHVMKKSLVFGTIFVTVLLATSASASSVSLVTGSYNFKLAGGCGGGTATLNGVNVNIFGDDFADKVTFPQNYTANVTTLSADANLDQTRFGETPSNGWRAINLPGHSAIATQDKAFFNHGNGSSALARYEMAAYLVSQYNVGQGSSSSNNQIQEAIWVLLDPAKAGAALNPGHVDASSFLEQAASWYSSMNTPSTLDQLDAFLEGFEIVSPTNMKFKRNGLLTGGFQEQIAMIPAPPKEVLPLHTGAFIAPTPEPRGTSLILLGLLGIGALLLHRIRRVNADVVA